MSANNGYIGRAPSDSSVVIAREKFTPSGVTTDFTFAANYDVGYLDAYLNGARLIDGSDYTAADGTTVSLITAAENGDVLELIAYKAFTVNNVTASTGDFSVGGQLSVTGLTTVADVYATGIITATSFVGDGSELTGVAGGKFASNDTGINTTTNVGVGTTTASSALTVTGDGTFTGVVTATTFSGNATGLSGTPSITVQDVTAEYISVAGTITYEDVTSVDSVGIVTARTGVRILDGGLEIVGNTTGLSVTGVATCASATFSGAIDANSTLDVDGDTQLDDLTVAGVATFSAGIDANSTLDVDGATQLDDLNVAGVATFSAYPAIDANDEIQVGTAIRLGKAGVITATSYIGDGSALTGVVSGIELKQGGSSVGTSLTAINFASGATLTSGSAGISTISISAGITTEAATPSNAVVALDLSSAQDHKVTATGIVTVTCSGGTEADSHTVRITSSGISTVGFSTYFLWPSGSPPNLNGLADGSIQLVSFTVQRVGNTSGISTQLLSGVSLNYS